MSNAKDVLRQREPSIAGETEEGRRRLLANNFEPLLISGKRPIVPDWTSGDITAERLAAWEGEHGRTATGTGLRCGRLAVVDIDIEDAALAEEIGAAVQGVLGLSDFRRIGAKGFQLCYYSPEPLRKVTISGRLPGEEKPRTLVEFLGQGQQIAAYGPHPSTGQPFTWPESNPLEIRLEELPAVTRAELRRAAIVARDHLEKAGVEEIQVTGDMDERSEPREIKAPDDLDPITPAMLRNMLAHVDPARGGDHNEWIGWLGVIMEAPLVDGDGSVADFGKADRTALAIEWSAGDLNPEHDPGSYYKGADYVEEKCGTVGGYSGQRKGLGSLIDEARRSGYAGPTRAYASEDLQAVSVPAVCAIERLRGIAEPANDDSPRDDDKPAPPPLRIASFADVLGREPQPVPELIPGRLEKGVVTFLAGHGEVGKSRLALQVGLCIQAGAPVFGINPEPATFVYLSAEDGEEEVTRRVHRIVKRLELPRDVMADSIYVDREGQNSALAIMRENAEPELTAFHDQLGNMLAKIPGHKFVVPDSAYDFVRFAGRAKIDEDCVNIYVKEILGGLCRDTDSSLYIPWHPSYAGQERGDGSGWSVAWHNAPRARDHFRYEKTSDYFVLEAVKRNHTVKPEPLKLVYSDGALIRQSDMGSSERSAKLREACIKFAEDMAKASQPLTTQKKLTPAQTEEMGKRVGYTVDSKLVKDELQRALMAGEIEYVPGSNTQRAGYYPKGGGDELARKSTAERRKGQRSKTEE